MLEDIRSRDTPGYWKKLTKEAGLELEDVEWLAKDRLKWWAEMMGRRERIEQWEKENCKRRDGEEESQMIERSQRVKEEHRSLVFKECGRECKSKGGLIIHRKHMHRQETLSEEMKEKMKCKYCEKMFRQAANRINHEKCAKGNLNVIQHHFPWAKLSAIH